jgi:hypothetical protein
MEAANGMVVSIPEDKLAEWQKAQDEIRAGKRPAHAQTDELTQKIIDRLKELGGQEK